VTTTYSKCPYCGLTRQTNHSREIDVCRDCKRYTNKPAPRDTWVKKAACREPDVNPRWFHAEDLFSGDREKALAVCATCPVRSDCLQHAIDVNETYGVWGGLTAPERHQLAYPRAI
jgi:WhiB family redox-sensing transcriptional regulator